MATVPPHCSLRPARRYPNPLATIAAGKLLPIRVVPGPEVARTECVDQLRCGACVFGGVPDPCWRRMTVGPARSAVRWRNHGGTCQGIVPCDVLHYRPRSCPCPDFQLADWAVLSGARKSRARRPAQSVGGEGFRSEPDRRGRSLRWLVSDLHDCQIGHHTRSRASVRNGSSDWLRGVEGKG